MSFNHGGQDVWLVQLVPDTILGIKSQELINENLISVFPNPVSNEFTVSSKHWAMSNGQLAKIKSQFVLYDVLGNEVLMRKLNTATTTVNTGQLSNAVYFYKIADEAGVLKRGKIVVEK